MGFGYRKRVRLGSGVHMNVSKSGLGLNVGRRGANITFSSKGTFVNLGIPGTGLYYRSKIGGSNKATSSNLAGVDVISSIPETITFICVFIAVLFIGYMLIFKTENYLPYLALLGIIVLVAILVYVFRETPEQIEKREKEERLYVFNNLLRTETDAQKKAYLSVLKYSETYNKDDLKTALSYYSCLPENIKNAFLEMTQSFNSIKGKKYYSKKIWIKHTSNSNEIYGYEEGFLFNTIIRIDDNFSYPQLFHVKNFSFFPTCLIIDEDKVNFSIKPYDQLKMKCYPIIVSSTKNIDGATLISDYWEHANLDGSKDNRYNNNLQYFVYQFGCLEIDGGYYIFSDIDGCEQFLNQLENLKLMLEGCEIDYSPMANIKYPEESESTEKSDHVILCDKLHKIINDDKLGSYSTEMKDIVELICNEKITRSQLRDYLSSKNKKLSDIQVKSCMLLWNYKAMSNDDGFDKNIDKRNLKYLKKLFHLSDKDVNNPVHVIDRKYRQNIISFIICFIKYKILGMKIKTYPVDNDDSPDNDEKLEFDNPVREEISFGNESDSNS